MASLIYSLLPALAVADGAVLESVDGDRTVVVYTAGRPRMAQAGDKIQNWDVVQTSKLSAAKLRYPDHSLVVVGRDTKFEVLPNSNGTQYNQLDWGQVRAQVEKTKGAPQSERPRFTIRTKTATMGVRGTDFVAGFDAGTGQSSLHTIEGTVDIARSESQVMSWQGVPVSAGQQVNLGDGLAPPAVGQFSPATYEQEVKASHPELVAMADVRGSAAEADVATDAVKAPAEMSRSEVKQLAAAPSGESALQLLSFRVGGVSLMADGQIFYTTGGLAWNPRIRIGRGDSIELLAGGYLLKNGLTSNTFPALKGCALGHFALAGPLHVEGGGGVEAWLTDSNGAWIAPSRWATWSGSFKVSSGWTGPMRAPP